MGPGFTLETALRQRNWGSTEEGREPSWSLSQSLETDEQAVGGVGVQPHTAADTLLAHCGGKRYKRAPREKERSGKRLSGRPAHFHTAVRH